MMDLIEMAAPWRRRSPAEELLANLEGSVCALRTIGLGSLAEERLQELLNEIRMERAPAVVLDRIHAILEEEMGR